MKDHVLIGCRIGNAQPLIFYWMFPLPAKIDSIIFDVNVTNYYKDMTKKTVSMTTFGTIIKEKHVNKSLANRLIH